MCFYLRISIRADRIVWHLVGMIVVRCLYSDPEREYGCAFLILCRLIRRLAGEKQQVFVRMLLKHRIIRISMIWYTCIRIKSMRLEIWKMFRIFIQLFCLHLLLYHAFFEMAEWNMIQPAKLQASHQGDIIHSNLFSVYK